MSVKPIARLLRIDSLYACWSRALGRHLSRHLGRLQALDAFTNLRRCGDRLYTRMLGTSSFPQPSRE